MWNKLYQSPRGIGLNLGYCSEGGGGHECHEGGQGVRLPSLEFELSFICVGFCLINDVRARASLPPGKGGPPWKIFWLHPWGV